MTRYFKILDGSGCMVDYTGFTLEFVKNHDYIKDYVVLRQPDNKGIICLNIENVQEVFDIVLNPNKFKINRFDIELKEEETAHPYLDQVYCADGEYVEFDEIVKVINECLEDETVDDIVKNFKKCFGSIIIR